MGLALKSVAAFTTMRRQVSAAARGAMMPEIRTRVGPAILKLISDEFNKSVDSYGVPWAPVQRYRTVRQRRADRRRAASGREVKGDKPLVDTGRMRASAVARVEGENIRVALPVDYASYHQDGTRFITRRPMLPDGRGIPEKWSKAILRETKAVMDKHFGRR